MGTSVYSDQGKDNQESSDEQLYYIAEHWRDDLAFFKDEIHFFHLLMDNNDLGKGDSGKKLVDALQKLHLEREALAARVNVHLHDYAVIEQDVLAQEEWGFRKEHARLEKEFAEFWKAFRGLKKEIFEVAGAAMRG